MDNNPDIEKDLEMCEESNIEIGTNVENAFEESNIEIGTNVENAFEESNIEIGTNVENAFEESNIEIGTNVENAFEESNIEIGTNVENAFEEESPMEDMTDEIKVLSLQLKKSTIVEPPVLTEINTLSKRLKRYSTLGSPSIRKQGIHLKQRLKSQRKSGITKKLKKMNKALRIQVKSATSKAGEMSLTNQRITETEEMLSTLAEGSSEYNQKKLHHDHLKEIQKNTMYVFHELLSNFKTMSEECTKLHKERFTENLKLLTEPKKLCDV